MARFEPAPGLEIEVARRQLAPAVARALVALRDEARRLAPSAKVWVTMNDERVRPSHVEADGQVIPANLRYLLSKPHGGHELAHGPRDPNLTVENRIQCRCQSLGIPDALARSIHASGVHVVGTRVTGQVYTDFPRAAESEFGDGESPGAHFMGGALNEVAARGGGAARRT